MEVSKEEFARLMKKAISISDIITQALVDEFKVSPGTLERWADGSSIPTSEMRLTILQRTTGIMLGALGVLADSLGENNGTSEGD